MRIPAVPRQSTADDTDTERTPVALRRDDDPTTTTLPLGRSSASTPSPSADSSSSVYSPPSANSLPSAYSPPPAYSSLAASETERARAISEPATVPAAPGPKARASFAATLGLILSVAGALLVLSGPLLGYGIGVAVLGLLFSVLGFLATRKRHVAGKGDAVIGLILSLSAIVVGVLALAGQLWWLGTDTQPVTELRQWLDARFEARL